MKLFFFFSLVCLWLTSLVWLISFIPSPLIIYSFSNQNLMHCIGFYYFQHKFVFLFFYFSWKKNVSIFFFCYTWKKLERNLIIPSNGAQTDKNGGFTWFSREIYDLRSIRTLKGVSPNKRIHLWIPLPKSACMYPGRPVSLSSKIRLEERWELLMKTEVVQRKYEYKSHTKHIAEKYENLE